MHDEYNPPLQSSSVPSEESDENRLDKRETLADVQHDTDAHPRVARHLLRLSEDYLSHLDAARRHAEDLRLPVTKIDELIRDGRRERTRYADRAKLRIDPRRRPGKEKVWDPGMNRPQYSLYLDECGVYTQARANDEFSVFCLCGVMVSREAYGDVDRRWRDWKREWLGSEDVVFHEPELRRWSRAFYNIPPEAHPQLLQSLDELVFSLDLSVITAVIDKRELLEQYPSASVNDFLPTNYYHMALDFVFERMAHFLYHQCEDGWGRVFAESRGKHEDARAQFEYVRLQVEGTEFMADRTFQYHLDSAMTFMEKRENHSGLQIADLLARACAEKALRPETTPARWETVKSKLYDGCKGEPEKYGLKLFPAHSRDRIFGKEKGDAAASPFSD